MEQNRTYIRDYTGDDSIAVFLAFAIEEYAVFKCIPPAEAAEILGKSGVLAHLAEFYDVLHTQGRAWLMDEIENMVEEWKGKQ